MTQEELSLLTRYRQKRDAEAFRELVTLHKDMVYAACHRILGNAADAEDAAQNCFLAFARTPERIKKSVGGWLHRVAVGTAIDHLRQEKARKERESRAVQEQGSSESVEWDWVAPAIDEAINELREDLRIPIIRYYLEGQKQEQIAQELNVTHSAVSKRLQRGTEALRGRLTKAGVALSVAALVTLLSTNAAEAAPAALTTVLGKIAIATLGTGGKSAAVGGGIGIVKVGAAIAVLSAAIVAVTMNIPHSNGQLNNPASNVAAPSGPEVPSPLQQAPPAVPEEASVVPTAKMRFAKALAQVPIWKNVDVIDVPSPRGANPTEQWRMQAMIDDTSLYLRFIYPEALPSVGKNLANNFKPTNAGLNQLPFVKVFIPAESLDKYEERRKAELPDGTKIDFTQLGDPEPEFVVHAQFFLRSKAPNGRQRAVSGGRFDKDDLVENYHSVVIGIQGYMKSLRQEDRGERINYRFEGQKESSQFVVEGYSFIFEVPLARERDQMGKTTAPFLKKPLPDLSLRVYPVGSNHYKPYMPKRISASIEQAEPEP